MRLRAAQIAAMRAGMRPQSQRRIRTHIETNYPSQTAHFDSAALDRVIADGITRAESHGLSREFDLAWFIAMQVTVSPRFDEQPTIRRLLREPEAGGLTTVEHVLAGTEDSDWRRAAEL